MIPPPAPTVAQLVAALLKDEREAPVASASTTGWAVRVEITPTGDGSPRLLLASFSFDPMWGTTAEEQAGAIAQNARQLLEEWRSTLGNPLWVQGMGDRIIHDGDLWSGWGTKC